MSWANAATITGAAAEIGGIGLVYWDVLKQRAHLGHGTPPQQLWAPIRRVLVRVRILKPRLVSVGASLTIKSDVDARGTLSTKVTRANPTLEQRVEGLERELENVATQQAEDRAESRKRDRERREQIERTHTEIRKSMDDREQRQRDLLQASLAIQWRGAGLFVVGLFLSAAGNLLHV